MFYATCTRGTKISIVTSGRARTPVPCSGYTSRMRFIATGRSGSYRVVADSSTEWAITWADYEPAH